VADGRRFSPPRADTSGHAALRRGRLLIIAEFLARLPRMKPARTLALIAVAAALSACASDNRNTDTPTGPGQLVNLTLQPVRVPPNPQGALALGAVTGCRIDFVGQAPAANTWQFRVSPTSRVPTVQQCLDSLKTQPGVEAVQVAK
jgi:hypothetical protein